jgi:hypothetical protein
MSSTVISKKLRLVPGGKNKTALILECFRGAATLKPYWNKWIVTDVWIAIINRHYDIDNSLKFKANELNAAVSRNKVFKCNDLDVTSIPNGMGLYKACKKTRDENKKNITTVAYFATTPNTLPSAPGGNSIWYRSIVSILPPENSHEKQSAERCLPDRGLMPTKPLAPTQKRRRGEAIIRNGTNGQFVVADPERAMKMAWVWVCLVC